MKTHNHLTARTAGSRTRRLISLLLAMCLLPVFALADNAGPSDDGWVTFLLICNEGMNNDKGNAGNTLMIISIGPDTGKIRMMMLTWDTFIDYEGYDAPQRLDMPYRNNGPEESMKVINANFGLSIEHFMSLNYLNLASLVDRYDGVTVDISRAERNALNGMVGSKKTQLQNMVASGLLSQETLDGLAGEYYLEEFGPNTRLNGLQAVGFGWLQYDSVYNCCARDLAVVSALFRSVGFLLSEHIVFWTDKTGKPEADDERRAINLDHVTEEDHDYLMRDLAPIFEMAFHNLTDEDIEAITWALARSAFMASRQGVNVFENIETAILPLEALEPYENIAGAMGHIVDKESNSAAMREFLYGGN
ncbi:MAG: LCP family protein [Clostridia bacterium]|nr:LCP family protein [Clostridia bacterium]